MWIVGETAVEMEYLETERDGKEGRKESIDVHLACTVS